MERHPPSTNEKPLSTTFYLVRHGQTDWNMQKKLQGQLDIPLNDTGRSEAAQLSEKLGEVAFEACFSSDLQRAAETAQILSAAHSLTIGLDPRLRERNFGPWEGYLVSEFMVFEKQDQQPLSIESDEAIRKRAFSCLNEIADLYPGSTVLIVTHGGVMGSLLSQLIPIERLSLFDIHIKNMALLQLSVSNGQCEIGKMEGIHFP